MSDLALVLTGGGARAAFQVGFLRGLGRAYPKLPVQIITGVSAGAINAAYLAARTTNLDETTARLEELWRSLEPEDVYDASTVDLTRNAVRWSMRLISGGSRKAPHPRGLVETGPLRELLDRELGGGDPDGRISRIADTIERGDLRALAISTTSYTTGQTITWVEARDAETWERTHRVSRLATITTRHVLASSSLPFMFPAVEIHGRWYGDGGVRLYAPLSPAIHLGASKILALSTRYDKTSAEADTPSISGYPPPAQVAGVLLNAVFLDLLDSDADRMHRFNRVLESLPPEERERHGRLIRLEVVRPSRDIGQLANDYEITLPRGFRFFMRGLGTRETRSNDLLSLLMFQSDYVGRLIDLGHAEFERRRGAIEEFLAAD